MPQFCLVREPKQKSVEKPLLPIEGSQIQGNNAGISEVFLLLFTL
jgi:hypothetical protein